MRHWEIKIKEFKTPHVIETAHYGNLSRKEVIDFFGLNNADVDWYEIKLIE